MAVVARNNGCELSVSVLQTRENGTRYYLQRSCIFAVVWAVADVLELGSSPFAWMSDASRSVGGASNMGAFCKDIEPKF